MTFRYIARSCFRASVGLNQQLIKLHVLKSNLHGTIHCNAIMLFVINTGDLHTQIHRYCNFAVTPWHTWHFAMFWCWKHSLYYVVWTPTTQLALFIEFIWRVLVTTRAASYLYGLFGWTDSVTGDTIDISKEFRWISLLQTSPQRSGLLSFVDLAGSERGRAKERHRCHCKQAFKEPP